MLTHVGRQNVALLPIKHAFQKKNFDSYSAKVQMK